MCLAAAVNGFAEQLLRTLLESCRRSNTCTHKPQQRRQPSASSDLTPVRPSPPERTFTSLTRPLTLPYLPYPSCLRSTPSLRISLLDSFRLSHSSHLKDDQQLQQDAADVKSGTSEAQALPVGGLDHAAAGTLIFPKSPQHRRALLLHYYNPFLQRLVLFLRPSFLCSINFRKSQAGCCSLRSSRRSSP